jgi:hypothetical protein
MTPIEDKLIEVWHEFKDPRPEYGLYQPAEHQRVPERCGSIPRFPLWPATASRHVLRHSKRDGLPRELRRPGRPSTSASREPPIPT